jgi:DNA repair exonuclease SbcCD ATPase subunit
VRIISVSVSGVRVLRDRVGLEGLSPGLNVIHGPNETGKSTLFEAFEAALFERHSAGHQGIRSLRSNRPGAPAPEVEVELELGGQRVRLHKRFLDRPEVRLERCGEVLHGAQAERALRELLGSERATNRGARDEHKGIWPLVWVRQGQGLLNPTAVIGGAARRSIDDALGGEVAGALAGGADDALLGRVEQEYARSWTATGRPRTGGPLAEALAAVEQARANHTQADQRWRRGRRLAHELAELERAVAAGATELARAREEAGRAAEALHEVGELERRRVALEAEAEARSERWQRLRAESGRRAQLADERARALAESAAARARLEEQRAAVARLQQKLAEASEASSTATGQLVARRRALEAARAALEANEAQEALAAARGRLATAEELGEERARLCARLEGLDACTPALLRQAEAAERDVLVACTRLEAVATRVELAAEGGAEVEVERDAERGEASGDGPEQLALGAGERRTLRAEGPLTLRLPGVLAVRVVPAGRELADLRVEAAAAERTRADLLARAGVEDMEALATQVERAEALRRRAAELAARLAGLSPAGPGALRDAHALLQQRLQQLIEKLGCEGPEALAPRAELLASLREAEQVEAVARDAEARAGEAQDRARSALERVRLELRTAEAASSAAEAAERRASAAVAAAREGAQDDGALAVAISQAAERTERARQAVAELDAQLERTDAAGVRERAERAGARVAGLEELARGQRERVVALGVELREARGGGSYAALTEAEERLRACERALEDVRQRAEAVKLLRQVLAEEQQKAERRFVAPVKERVDRWLGALVGDDRGGVTLNERLEVVGLDGARPGHGGDPGAVTDFEALSSGMREQLGLLVRLALARVLAGDGTLPVIIDDGVVHTDAVRFQRLLSVLEDAAGTLQVILLTCHPERYAGLRQAARFDLQALVEASRTSPSAEAVSESGEGAGRADERSDRRPPRHAHVGEEGAPRKDL